MKPLDIVKVRENGFWYYGIVTEFDRNPNLRYEDGTIADQASVTWFRNNGDTPFKAAWWDDRELTVVDNLANLLARCTKHPFSSNEEDDGIDTNYPI